MTESPLTERQVEYDQNRLALDGPDALEIDWNFEPYDLTTEED